MDYTKYHTLLKEFIKYKSISTDSKYTQGIQETANWLSNLFKDNNFDVDQVKGYGNDIIVAKYKISSNAKSVLVYGHYDVQPANIDEGWTEDPFELCENNGRLFARGVVDNKGQVLIHIATVLDLIDKKELGYNIIFMVEGNEETGSPLLEKFIHDYKDKLKCDYVFFSDGELSMGYPIIESGFRGVLNLILTIKTSSKDNHSGLFGGSIPNASHVLTNVISQMHDQDGILSLPGLDNTVPEISIPEIPFDENEFKHVTGSKVRLNNSLNFYLQNGYLTSAEVTTLNSGYQGEGFRNAIPGYAFAKINFRIAPQHNLEMVKKAFEAYLSQVIPEYVEYSLDFHEGAEPITLDTDNEFAQKAEQIAAEVYGVNCYKKFCGAIVPVSGIFKDVLKAPVISLGLGNEDCNMHGVNENFEIDLIKKGLNLSNKVFKK